MIRTLRASDIPRICAITRERMGDTVYSGVDDAKAEHHFKSFVFAHVSSPFLKGWVLELNGTVEGIMLVGLAKSFWTEKMTAVIELIFVTKRALGKGAWLLKTAIKWAKDNPTVHRVALSPSSGIDQPRADELFQRLMGDPQPTYFLEV